MKKAAYFCVPWVSNMTKTVVNHLGISVLPALRVTIIQMATTRKRK